MDILAALWNSPEAGHATGCSTTGSSEAAMLGGLAMKWRWRQRAEKAGRATDKPNLVMGANVQVCWEKFCRYWDVEARMVPMEGERFHLDAEQAVAHCDENTIGVVAILGSTFDGSYEPIKDIAAALDDLQEEQGLDIPGARRRGLRRVRRAVHPARARMGLPHPARAVDQRLGPQVRPGVPGDRVGDLARRGGAAPRPRVQRQLPGRQHADVRAQLLASGQPGHRPVLHVRQPRLRGLPAGDAGRSGHGGVPVERDRRASVPTS